MRIGVVGSGIAGLSAAWLLERGGHEVTLLERLPEIGMRAHGVDVGGHTVDVPLRVFNPLLWRNLVALADALSLPSRAVDVACSFGDLDGEVYLRYTNLEQQSRNWPLGFQPRYLPRHLEALFNVGKLRVAGGRDLGRGELAELRFGDYLDDSGYGDRFVLGYLFPLLATVCTCSNEALRAYPADVLVDALNRVLVATSLRRVEGGTNTIVRALVDQLSDVRTSVEVRAIEPTPGAALVHLAGGGETLSFEHVLLATQANHAVDLLDEKCGRERALLARVPYEGADISVHTDLRFLPARREDWSPLNFQSPADRAASMSTIFVNRIDGFDEAEPVLQTWNPLMDVAPDHEVMRTHLERPVVTHDSARAVAELRALDDEVDRRVWLVGSYASEGVPLLESGVASSLRVAERLGVARPWRVAA
jgi:predicted NAD/FAD-binding protein